MRRRRAALLALIVGIGACGGAADHEGDESLAAELRLSPTPPMTGTAGVSIRATDNGVGIVPPGRVTVEIPGTSPPPEQLTFQNGSWVGSLEFPAPGDAQVEVSITTADGRTATVGVPVLVVRRP